MERRRDRDAAVGWRLFSMIAAQTRGTAIADPFNVCAICVPFSPPICTGCPRVAPGSR
jgi:hypothetical protein